MTLYALDGVAPQVPEDDDFWVAPGAHVVGNVILRSGSSVWFGSTIRGDNELIEVGAGTNIQENCVLHTDPGYPMVLGRDVTVGHRAMLHGCSIADGALIGMGATILNGAKIGAGALIGACALVTEGKEIPPGALVVGSPGKVVRQLSEEEIERQRQTAMKYAENQRRFRKGMAAI